MNLFEKMKLAVKGAAHDVVDSVTDKNAMAEQAVREMEQQYRDAINALDQINGRKLLQEKDINDLKEQTAKYLASAKKAKDAGDMELAKACLEKKNVAQTKLDTLVPIFENLTTEIQALEEAVADKKADLEKAKSQVELLQAKSEVADLQMETAKALTGSGSGKDYGSALNELEADVNARAATAQAKTARAKADSGADLDKRIAKLEKSKSIDDELANL